jgi:hypothetical protein
MSGFADAISAHRRARPCQSADVIAVLSTLRKSLAATRATTPSRPVLSTSDPASSFRPVSG